MIGWEAQLWLRHCLEGGVLEDPAVDYLAEKVDEMDAAALLEAMGLIRKRLAEIEAFEGTDEGERIRVTKDYRILLPDRFDTDLPDYRNELMDLYRGITRREGGPELEASIDRLVNPRDNSIHEKAANLAAALSKYFPPEKLHAYTLTGKAGASKRIRLDRARVEWE